MKFDAIPGLDETKKLLAEAVMGNHLPHAQLFVGPEGHLGLPMALALATYLHCTNRGTDACGVCPACSKSLKYIHPDTHFVFPVSNTQGEKDEDRFKAELLKEWRTFLLEQPFGSPDDWLSYFGGEDKQPLISRDESREIIKTLALKPFESQVKIMLIWQPEFMHPSAANGILKILEEPPPFTYFFLVTNEIGKLLPTILSRTQAVNVPLLSDGQLIDYLISQHKQGEARAKKIAHLANGNMQLAQRLVNEEEDQHASRFIEWMRACYAKKYIQLVTLAENFHHADKLEQRNFLSYAQSMLRECLVHLYGAQAMLRLQGEELKFVQDFSKVLNLDKVDHSYQLINDASLHLERNGSAKMIFLDTSVQLSRTLNPS